MKFLEKVNFKPFPWLDFENLPKSEGYKFELYSKSELSVQDFAMIFYSLFNKSKDGLYIGQFGINAEWGDFCIDTWDFINDKYDYSPEGKSKSTAAYLNMLIENEIESDYNGYCKSLNWDKFLPVILECILSRTATYSVMIYSPEAEFVFYFHHTGIGVYYNELNVEVKHIIERAKNEDLEIINTNDERIRLRT